LPKPGRRLGVLPRRGRRRHPPRLRRGPPRREGADRGGLPAPRGRLVLRARRGGRAGDDRQRLAVYLGDPPPDPARARPSPPSHPALPPPDQRQGRALHPDDVARMGIWEVVRELSGAAESLALLAFPLQLPQTTRLPRPPAARFSARRAPGTTWLGTT